MRQVLMNLALAFAIATLSIAAYLEYKQFTEFQSHLQVTIQGIGDILDLQSKQLQTFQTQLGKLDVRLIQVEKEIAKGKGKDF